MQLLLTRSPHWLTDVISLFSGGEKS